MKNRDFIQESLNATLESLQSGTAPFSRAWEASELANQIPYNPTTQRIYNGINCINLMLSPYKDQRWLTYEQTQKLKANVKKGEKAKLIQYWQFVETTNKLDEQGNPIVDNNGKVEIIETPLETPKVFYAYVFNGEQVNNLPKQETNPINQIEAFKQIDKLLENANVISGNKAFYDYSKDTITLPPKESFKSEAEYYTNALCQLGHWSGHKKRLNRDIGHPIGSKEYAKETLGIEIFTFLASARLGLDYTPIYSQTCRESWINLLKNNPNEIFKASANSQKILDFIDGLNLGQTQTIATQNTNTQAQEANIAHQNTYLYVPYTEKDEAKKAGAKWDKEAKMWYAPKDSNLNNFTRWSVPQSNSSNINPQDEFKTALQVAGLRVDEPIMDGKLHRVSVDGDKGNQKSGAYVGYLNGHPAGFIQNYKTGYKENWKSSASNQNNRDQQTAILNAIEANKAQKQQREEELHRAYLQTATKLENEFNEAKWANTKNPYLQSKGFNKNFYLKQDKHGNLLIPLRDIEGKYWATQRIFTNGDKMIGALRTQEEKQQNITYPAKKQGNFFLFGAKNLSNVKEVFICEGFATAASVYEATKKPTIMGIDAGNLEVVITNIKQKYPQTKIAIAGDNDIKKELENGSNVGKTTALAIQEKYPDIKVVLPQFTKEEAQKGLSDFNDLMQSRSLEEVKRQIREQMVQQLSPQNLTTQQKSINRNITNRQEISMAF